MTFKHAKSPFVCNCSGSSIRMKFNQVCWGDDRPGVTSFLRSLRRFLASTAGPATFAAALSGTVSFAQDTPSGMSNAVVQQIQAIVTDKMQRTDAQNKIEPALLYAARNALGLPQFPNAPTLQLQDLSAKVDTDGQVLVDIGTTTGAGALADLISSLGGSVISSFPQYNAMRAKLPVTALETLAASPLVKNIRTAEEPVTNKIDPPPSLQNRSENVHAKLADALNSVGTGTTNIGGCRRPWRRHRAERWRQGRRGQDLRDVEWRHYDCHATSGGRIAGSANSVDWPSGRERRRRHRHAGTRRRYGAGRFARLLHRQWQSGSDGGRTLSTCATA